MKLKIKNTKDVVKDGVKCIIYGSAGIGKTTQLGTLKGKSLILSAESGLLVLKDKDMDIIDIDSIDALGQAYLALKNGDLQYDNICIDSLSEIGDMLVTELENDDYYGDPSNTFPKWAEYSKRMTKIVKMFRDLKGFNVIFTALAEPTESNGSIVYLPMIPAKKVQARLVSLFDEVMYYAYDKDSNRVIHTVGSNIFEAKSRSGLPPKVIVDDKNNLGSLLEMISK